MQATRRGYWYADLQATWDMFWSPGAKNYAHNIKPVTVAGMDNPSHMPVRKVLKWCDFWCVPIRSRLIAFFLSPCSAMIWRKKKFGALKRHTKPCGKQFFHFTKHWVDHCARGEGQGLDLATVDLIQKKYGEYLQALPFPLYMLLERTLSWPSHTSWELCGNQWGSVSDYGPCSEWRSVRVIKKVISIQMPLIVNGSDNQYSISHVHGNYWVPRGRCIRK